MNDFSEEPATIETSWRQYYDNPLTVATNAMLHINGEDQAPISLIYQDGSFKPDTYPPEVAALTWPGGLYVPKNQWVVPSGTSVPGRITQDGEATALGRHQTNSHTLKDSQASALPNTSVGGALEIKLSNGTIEAVQGAAHVESILLQGGAELVKPEPEDLTRKCISPAERIVLSDKRRPVLLQGPPQSDSPPALIPTQQFKDEFEPVVKEEDRQRVNHTIIIQAPLDSGDKMSAGGYLGSFPSPSPQSNYESVPYLAQSPQPYVTSTSPVIRGSPAVYSPAEPYYREYYQVSEPQYTSLRQEYSATEVTLDRYTRPAPSYKPILTVDSSPDSGISSDTVPTREQALSLPQQQGFASYEDLGQSPIITTDLRPVGVQGTSPGAQRNSPSVTPAPSARSWHDFSRHNEGDKIQIPKIQSDDDKIHIEKIDSPYGFKFYLETPISTSPRREDDRITYINKGQFYGITMEYIPDPERPLKPGPVKSIVMLMFREEKSSEDESKAWHFWHGRQHSVKQRILDVDTKNSLGLVSCIEEVSHNAISVYWNPLESSAKINVAVQCLSTDFSSQKGVKGLPLHIQIDTYDEPRDTGLPVYHRAYCQIKVFCDKGAERKTRDEERRAQKRRINPNTRKKYEELYHAPCDRSEFYTMADLMKEPVFFKPSEDVDKVAYMNMDMPSSFYNHDPENGVCGVSLGTSMDGPSPTILSPQHLSSSSPAPSLPQQLSSVEVSTPLHITSHVPSSCSSSPLPCSPPPPPPTSTPIYSQCSTPSLTTLVPLQHPVSPKTNRFQYSLPQTYGEVHKEMSVAVTNGVVPVSSMEEMFSHAHKRTRLTPPMSERIMLFVRTDGEDIYTPLHLVPPGISGLLNAIEQKFQISRTSIKTLFRKNKVGIRARIDDDMLLHYCNEDCFIIDIQRREPEGFDVTLIELPNRGDQ